MTDDRVTKKQIAHIFAIGRERGMTTDDLREMTPAGSISMLTRVQAMHLIDALKRGKSPDYEQKTNAPRKPRQRRPKNVIRLVTDDQRALIEALRIDLDWTEDQLDAWLRVRHFPGESRNLTQMQTSKDAQFVIELLKRVLDKTIQGRQRSAAGQSTASA